MKPGAHPVARTLIAWAVFGFLLLPTLAVVLYSLYPSAYAIFPPQGLTGRWYVEALNQRALFLDPLWTSVVLAAQATAISTVVGTLLAFGLRNAHPRFRSSMRGVTLAPMLVPALVTGFGILLLLNRLGLFGSYAGLLAGHVIITLPFVYINVSAGLSGVDPEVEEASLSLGANRLVTAMKVILPLLRGSIFAGATFAFIVSFDQVELTLFLADPTTITLPVQIFSYVQQRSSPTIAAVAVVLVIVNLIGLLILQRVGGLNRRVY